MLLVLLTVEDVQYLTLDGRVGNQSGMFQKVVVSVGKDGYFGTRGIQAAAIRADSFRAQARYGAVTGAVFSKTPLPG